MTQTMAIFLSAYRELSARRLFWLALVINVLVVALFASLGINEQGISFFGWTFDSPFYNSTTTSPETFYKSLFVALGVDWWLGLIATLLALVTTCGIIPDLVAPGSIDLLLAKPIGRARLFLTKYATGLLFAALQVCVFSLASFAAIGLRGGVWEWGLFLAVPIVTFFYSLLYCICALVGMLTKSSVASLILTLLAWTVIFSVNLSESIVVAGRIANSLETAAIEKELAAGVTQDGSEPLAEDDLEALRTDLQKAKDNRTDWDRAYFWFHGIKSFVPKTGDTLELLDRWLLASASMPTRDPDSERGPQRAFGPRRVKRGEYERALKDEERSRSIAWVLGTSAAFEAGILLLATVVFVRRDY
ncbi:MAG: ABC transporter permease [Planctomycetota bacterium]